MNTDKTEIVQELGRSFVRTDVPCSDEGYMIRMLTDNKIEGIPICKREAGTEKPVLKYDVSNMKSLRREFEDRAMHFEDLKWLLYGISGIITSALSYLLDESMFLFDPDYIFIDMEDDSLNMIYVPEDNDRGDKEGIYRRLADFILDKTDHREESAVSIAYQFYKMSKEELFSMLSFCSLINKEQPSKAVKYDKSIKSSAISPGSAPEDTAYENDRESFLFGEDVPVSSDDKKGAKGSRIKAGLPIIITSALLSAEVVLYIITGSKGVYTLQILTLILLTGIVLIALIISKMINHVRRKKEKELESEMSGREVSVSEYWGGDEETTFFEDEKTMFFDTEKSRDHTLVWKENGEEKKEVLKGSTVTLGKKFDEVDICITDPTVSRKHARMVIKGGDIFLQDMGSTNGTYIDGERIEPGKDIKLPGNRDFLLGRVQVRVV